MIHTRGRKSAAFQTHGLTKLGSFPSGPRLKIKPFFRDENECEDRDKTLLNSTFWSLSLDYKVFDARMETVAFLNEKSFANVKFSMGTSMVELKPVVTENYECEYRDKSIFLTLFKVSDYQDSNASIQVKIVLIETTLEM